MRLMASAVCHSSPRFDYPVTDEPGDRLVEVVELLVLSLVDPIRVVVADPLAPAMKHQLAFVANLISGVLRVADKDEVGLVTGSGEAITEVAYSDTQAARQGIAVRPLKREHHKLGVVRRDCRWLQAHSSAAPLTLPTWAANTTPPAGGNCVLCCDFRLIPGQDHVKSRN
jgi:hypothetical protein